MTMITRRSALAAALAASALPALAQGQQNIRISTAAPPSDFLTKLLERVKSEVEAHSVGLSITVHPASTLFRQGTEVQALQRGNLEMSTMTTFEVAQQVRSWGS